MFKICVSEASRSERIIDTTEGPERGSAVRQEVIRSEISAVDPFWCDSRQMWQLLKTQSNKQETSPSAPRPAQPEPKLRIRQLNEGSTWTEPLDRMHFDAFDLLQYTFCG